MFVPQASNPNIAFTPEELGFERVHFCGYQYGTPNHCNAPIVRDEKSYSGWRHQHPADWCHWATPVHYDRGLQETNRIFLKCAVCGKAGDANDAHIKFNGHKFEAARKGDGR